MISNRGFSLIEVLVATTLFMVAFTGLVKLQIMMERNAEFALKSIDALYAAKSQMEKFRAHSEHGSPTTFEQITSQSSPIMLNGMKLTWSVENHLAVDGITRLKSVTIIAAWDNRWQQSESVSLTGSLSRYSGDY